MSQNGLNRFAICAKPCNVKIVFLAMFYGKLHILHNLHKYTNIHIRTPLLTNFLVFNIIYIKLTMQFCNLCNMAVFSIAKPLFYLQYFAQIALNPHKKRRKRLLFL